MELTFFKLGPAQEVNGHSLGIDLEVKWHMLGSVRKPSGAGHTLDTWITFTLSRARPGPPRELETRRLACLRNASGAG